MLGQKKSVDAWYIHSPSHSLAYYECRCQPYPLHLHSVSLYKRSPSYRLSASHHNEKGTFCMSTRQCAAKYSRNWSLVAMGLVESARPHMTTGKFVKFEFEVTSVAREYTPTSVVYR